MLIGPIGLFGTTPAESMPMLWIVVATYALLLVVCTVRIAGGGHSPAAAWAWLLAVWMLPVAGMTVYMMAAWQRAPSPCRCGGCRSAVESVVAGGCGALATDGNSVALLNDGGQMYPSLIHALHRARRSIHLEYYIFVDDRIGTAIADILCRKVRAGVEVRLMYDAVGSLRLSRAMVRRLRDAGVEVRAFGRVRFPWLTPSFNIRNHRKIAVIDGRTAFIGGINIARRYLDGDELGRWRDEHLSIEGGAVAYLQRLFAADWCAAGGHPFDTESRIAPEARIAAARGGAESAATTGRGIGHEGVRVQIGWSQTGPTRRTLAAAFMAAIMQARSEIMISTPYFIPPQPLLQALCTASACGVRVRLMVPMRGDMRAAVLAGESYFGELLAAGVEIYLYDCGFLHSKTMVIDSRIASVGTANMDFRSLCTNWEVAAFVYDENFGRIAAATFERDLLGCRRLEPSEYDSRPLRRRIACAFCRLFSPML